MRRVIGSFLVVAALLALAVPVVVAGGGGTPQVSVSQEADGRWIVNIVTDAPVTINVNGQPAAFVPAPQPSGERLWGSCSVLENGRWTQFDLEWNDFGRLHLAGDNLRRLAEAHRTSKVVCHLSPSTRGAVVEADGRNIAVPAGQDWWWEFPPGNFQAGFAANMR